MKRSILSIFALLLFSDISSATTIHVPDVQPTIQEGIAAASSGDTVLVACGTYFEHRIHMKSGVVLLSASGQAECVTIDAQQQSYVIVCDESDETTKIEGFSIVGGSSDFGGGLLCFSASPTISRCSFQGNHSSTHGGGIFISGSSPQISDCTLSDNSAIEDGGGLYCYDSAAVISDCVIQGNTSFHGGGISCTGNSPEINSCTIIGNNTTSTRWPPEAGGGIYLEWSHASIVDSHIEGNVSGWGGGIYGSYSNATITGCVISENSASDGGGIDFDDSQPSLVSCSIINNTSTQGGGVILFRSDMSLTNCTIVGNTADEGGGIWCKYCDPILESCILSFSELGSAIHSDYDAVPVILCTDIFGNAGGDWDGVIADQLGTVGNFALDPFFCSDDNLSNLHLRSNSPCAPGNHPDGYDCGLIGALPVDCDETSAESISWGKLKAYY